MTETRFTRRQALLSAAALAVVACTPGANTGASPTAAGGRAVAPFRWIFGFTIQANPSMPVIIAKELGYFDTQDLKVTWDFVSPSATGIRLMGTGQYEAGSTGDVGSVVTYVNENLPIKVIAQQSQVTSRALAVKKGSGITRPKDFEGKKVGIKSNIPWTEYLAMLAYDKVDRSKIREIPVGFSSVELKEGIVDVLPVFTGNEPYVLRNQLATEVDLLLPSDYGVPGVGSMMVANTNFIKNNRDVAIRFLKAVMHAQEYMLAERDKTIQMAIQYGGTATAKEQHAFIYDVSKREMEAGEVKTKGQGWISKDAWQKNIDILVDLGVVKTAKPKFEDLVDTSLIEEVVKDGKVVWP
jgi:ABC-type nitrate/sulfonate/bicarbonate transport system substrate-binding protein